MVNILASISNFYEDFAKKEVKKYINNMDKVVVIPFSFSEQWIKNEEDFQKAYNRNNGKYYGEIVKPFIELGIKEDNIKWLNYYKDSSDKMKEIIKNSDIVFLTGGFPEKAVERVMEKGLVEEIQDSRVVIGISAGALMQLSNYFVTPDEDYPEFNYYKGLKFIKDDFYIEVHYENSEIQNKCINKALKEKTHKVYAISNNGGLIYDNGNITVLGEVTEFN